MKLVIKIEVQDNFGKTVADTGGTLRNVEELDATQILNRINAWIGETIMCLLLKAKLGNKTNNRTH